MFMRIFKKIFMGLLILLMGFGILMLGTIGIIARAHEDKEPDITYQKVSTTITVDGQDFETYYTVGVTQGLN